MTRWLSRRATTEPPRLFGYVREGRGGLEPPTSASDRTERCTNRPGSYPSLVQWGHGPTPDPRPDPVTVNVQLP
jgi:hypothetical protein